MNFYIRNTYFGYYGVIHTDDNLHGIELGITKEDVLARINTRYSANEAEPDFLFALGIDQYINQNTLVKPLFKIAVEGTDFQKQVWNEISSIPKNKTLSYKQIAMALKKPKAFRAVASACKANPIAIIIPCHRVRTSLNEVSGYNWGLDIHSKILEKEKQ